MHDSLEDIKNKPNVPLYDLVYQSLRQNIIRGVYEAGERLTEDEISKSAGVSRTPVREALKRLAAEGLIEFIPKKGAIVMHIDDDEIAMLWDIRIFAESKAAELAANKANDKDKRRLTKIVRQMKKAIEESDINTFDDLVSALNSEIIDIADVNQLNRLYKMVDHFSWDTMNIIKKQVDICADNPYANHILIADAIIHKEAEKAKTLTKQHLINWKGIYLHYFLDKTTRK